MPALEGVLHRSFISWHSSVTFMSCTSFIAALVDAVVDVAAAAIAVEPSTMKDLEEHGFEMEMELEEASAPTPLLLLLLVHCNSRLIMFS